jgi:hypothetical protein
MVSVSCLSVILSRLTEPFSHLGGDGDQSMTEPFSHSYVIAMSEGAGITLPLHADHIE